MIMKSASSLSLNSNTSSSNSTVDTEDQQSLPPPQQPKTIYECIRLIYSRNGSGFLSSRCYNNFELNDEIFHAIRKNEAMSLFLQDGLTQLNLGDKYYVWEKQIEPGVWQGAITIQFNVTDFEYWFLILLVSQARVSFSQNEKVEDFELYTKMVSATFARELKHTVENDQWEAVGEAFFNKGVDFFTSRWQPLEAVLPAFPCKSSNVEKVSGDMPDKGEELALRRLIQFSESIKEIYPPGIIIWIVSDGHVFSDCIAVDDSKVNRYFQGLQQLYANLKPKNANPIRFCSLPEIFQLANSNFNNSLVADVELGHYLGTEIDSQSETCRKILVTSCDTDCGKLRQDITTKGHPRLALFRGFSKFMTEDLALHPKVSGMARKKFKKIVAKVAFEMIKRNDAYSNLVELMFPFHLRFSIHAHCNSGPKFGISLLSKTGENQCQPINSIDDHKEPQNTDLLHIPTPWHNTIVKIDDRDVYFVIKSKKVEQEIENGNGRGEWDPINLHYMFFSK
ncbi:hypothetical protein G210_0817 [Candida maltosa Xu316]|uniref:Dit1p n=1 Tax=Candida maltosa (strain Xu316) TaxID=1245528 RepID=M3JZZ5_CANMX|nr:hypothetical protein G210_0817 [Candida maltosa Xu316]